MIPLCCVLFDVFVARDVATGRNVIAWPIVASAAITLAEVLLVLTLFGAFE